MAAQSSLIQDDITTVLVYPNPSDGTFNISLPDKENFDLVLNNSLGEEILRESVSGNSYTINQNTLPNGMYTLNINSNGKNRHIKIIVGK